LLKSAGCSLEPGVRGQHRQVVTELRKSLARLQLIA
jgi:hypothetical protein